MIRLRCSCGKGLRVKDEAAGKRIKCPACGTILTVPRPEPAEPPPDDGLNLAQEGSTRPSSELGIEPGPQPEGGPEPADAKNCPQCLVALSASAVICSTCGYDYRTGKTFEAPRTLMQKVPWKTVGKVVWSVLGLAILIGAAYFGYEHIKGKQEARKAAGTAGSPDKGRSRRPGRDTTLPPIVVRTGFTYPQPRLRKDFKFHYDDGVYSPAKTRLTLRAKIAAEAVGSLRAAGLEAQVHKKDEKPPEGSLTLRIPVAFGWIYQRVDGQLQPKQPYVKSCAAYLFLRKNIVVWKSAKVYAASPPALAAKPSPAELEAVASLPSAKASLSFQGHAQKAAEPIVNTILAGVPEGSALRKLLDRSEQDEKRVQSVLENLKPAAVSRKALKLIAGGNQYVIAALADSLDDISDEAVLKAIIRGAGDPALAQRAEAALAKLAAKSGPSRKPGTPPRDVPNADKLLLELAKTKFRQPAASFARELPVVEAAARRFPHLALVFAKTALNLELDDPVKNRLRKLCTDLQAKRPSLAEPRAAVLRQLARDAEAHLLGRAALWTLLTSDAKDVEAPARTYLAKVAAGRLPDAAEPGDDGKLYLAKSQLAILRQLARRSPGQGTEAAVALLMRATSSQRDLVRRHVALPPVEGQKLTAMVRSLKSNKHKDIHDALLLAVRSRTPLRPLMAHMADAIAASDDPRLRAVIIYALAKTAERKDPYLWSLAAMLGAPEPDARRAAAERLRKLGPDAALVLPEVKAALDKETDGATRARLSAAVRGIGGPNP